MTTPVGSLYLNATEKARFRYRIKMFCVRNELDASPDAVMLKKKVFELLEDM